MLDSWISKKYDLYIVAATQQLNNRYLIYNIGYIIRSWDLTLRVHYEQELYQGIEFSLHSYVYAKKKAIPIKK